MEGGYIKMIFVTLGTQDKSFVRLLREIDKLIANNVIVDDVIVQAGFTKYSSDKMKIIDYVSMEEFNNYVQESNLIITHGGVGSILAGCMAGKKVIAVARLAKYNEHESDHQIQIVKEFGSYGYILGCLEVTELGEALTKVKEFIPRKYIPNNKKMCNIITKFIDNNC